MGLNKLLEENSQPIRLQYEAGEKGGGMTLRGQNATLM